MKKKIALILLILMLLPVRVFAANSSSDTVSLNNCVDGNSARFMLGLQEIKVRFLGIEVEETLKENGEIKGTLVSDYVCDSLKKAKKIKIEYEPNAEKEDKFGRIQAWVFLDDVLLQEDLVKLGYAKVMYIDDNYLYSEKLKTAQNSAREMKIGIWEDYVEEVVVDKDDEPKKEEKKEPKGFFGKILDFICGLFEKLLKFIDDIISNVL